MTTPVDECRELDVLVAEKVMGLEPVVTAADNVFSYLWCFAINGHGEIWYTPDLYASESQWERVSSISDEQFGLEVPGEA